MNIWRFNIHYNQQVIMSLLFYQASHEGRIYLLPKLQKRVALRFRVFVSEWDTFRHHILTDCSACMLLTI